MSEDPGQNENGQPSDDRPSEMNEQHAESNDAVAGNSADAAEVFPEPAEQDADATGDGESNQRNDLGNGDDADVDNGNGDPNVGAGDALEVLGQETAKSFRQTHGKLEKIAQFLVGQQRGVRQLGTHVEKLAEQVELVTRHQEAHSLQMRRLSHKVDSITTSVSESRLKAVLEHLLLVHDLLQNMRASVGQQECAQMFGAVLNEILKIFKKNGIREVDTTGSFDADVHNALACVDTGDRERNDTIHEVYRKGFQTDFGLLRAADVAIYKFSPTADPCSSDNGAETPESDVPQDHVGSGPEESGREESGREDSGREESGPESDEEQAPEPGAE